MATDLIQTELSKPPFFKLYPGSGTYYSNARPTNQGGMGNSFAAFLFWSICEKKNSILKHLKITGRLFPFPGSL